MPQIEAVSKPRRQEECHLLRPHKYSMAETDLSDGLD